MPDPPGFHADLAQGLMVELFDDCKLEINTHPWQAVDGHIADEDEPPRSRNESLGMPSSAYVICCEGAEAGLTSTAGEVLAQPLLPSARYQAAVGELGDAWLQPWLALGAFDAAPAVIGRWARDLGAAVPGRLVASAKSWLSYTPGWSHGAPLALGAADDVAKVSPLQASASYLAHVRAAWDSAHPAAPLHAQTVVLTVPASFDEGARALTLEAAQLAGLPQVHLLEEPKAAFPNDWAGACRATKLAAATGG
ncbi:hypothetical protein FQA39_LY18669 [Lamprigera yunnana]|nr:hypothetical protein FQA39_LY18669 [Lamprigera yunnana]